MVSRLLHLLIERCRHSTIECMNKPSSLSQTNHERNLQEKSRPCCGHRIASRNGFIVSLASALKSTLCAGPKRPI